MLLNLGGPDSLEAVRPFLYNLFSDRKIIQLGPPFLQKPIARLISAMRSKKTERYYRLIGGKSPILDITISQARALEEALNQQSAMSNQPSAFKVYVGMRYWHPLIEDVIPQVYNDGIRKLVAFSLYPQYSVATAGSSISKFEEAVSRYPIKYSCVPSWHDNPLYIKALVDVIKKGMESFKADSPIHQFTDSRINILFSAHSLPEKFINEGDPYADQIKGTINEVLKFVHAEWHLSYQSKSGPVKWLEPSTYEKLKELAGRGIKNILMVPISFVSDHIETLYEIDILYRQMAEKLGIKLKRTASLNTHPFFIEALRDIVIKSIKELGWAE